MVPVSLRFISLARLEQETGVSLGPKFQRIQTVDQKGKKAKLQFREKNPGQEPETRDTVVLAPPHYRESISNGLGESRSGIFRTWFISGLDPGRL